MIDSQNFKTATVAIIGRPSSGKSTFLNTASGQKISIISAIPQTTRNIIRGIINRPHGQLVFIDTPGYHASEKKMNLKMKTLTESILFDSDVIVYMIDVSRSVGEEELRIAELIAPFANKVVFALNKIDTGLENLTSIKILATQHFPKVPASRIVSVSAQKNTNIDQLLDQIFHLAPVAPALYPEEYYTDQNVDFRIAEIIREKAINATFEEIPHSLYVEIADMEWKEKRIENQTGEDDNVRKTLWVRAFLIVERESQKGMVIGKKAQVIKSIRIESIKTLRKIFDYKIELDLQVKVNKNWRQKSHLLTKLIN
ncbi:MAG: GTPase Era [Treponemataceae bacterium]